MRRILFALAALAAIIFVAPQAARAQTEGVSGATLRVIHAAAAGPGVDIYVDGQRAEISRDFFSEATVALERGDHDVLVARTGDSPDDALVGKRIYADRGDSYTLALIGAGDAVTGLLLQDRSDSPQPDEARVRIIHAGQGVGPLDMAVADRDPFLSGAVFGSATYVDVPTGTYAFDLAAAQGEDLLRTVEMQLLPGWTYTLVVTGSGPENLWVQALVDRPAR